MGYFHNGIILMYIILNYMRLYIAQEEEYPIIDI